MSRLYYSEEGRVIPSLGEELTRFRHVRKTLDLPATEATARVWILARCHPDNTAPLHLSVNGSEVTTVGVERRPACGRQYLPAVDGHQCHGRLVGRPRSRAPEPRQRGQ